MYRLVATLLLLVLFSSVTAAELQCDWSTTFTDPEIPDQPGFAYANINLDPSLPLADVTWWGPSSWSRGEKRPEPPVGASHEPENLQFELKVSPKKFVLNHELDVGYVKIALELVIDREDLLSDFTRTVIWADKKRRRSRLVGPGLCKATSQPLSSSSELSYETVQRSATSAWAIDLNSV